jgi:hypothetical protein
MNEIYWKKNKKYREENITNVNDVTKNKWISILYVRKESKFIKKKCLGTPI